jgi:hypothetical protein
MNIAMFRLSAVCTLSVLLGLAWSAKAAIPARTTLVLTETDKAQIIRSILRRELKRRKQPKGQTVLLLDSPYIKPGWLPTLSNVKIELLNQSEIEARVATNKVVSYFFFGSVQIKNRKVKVSFGQREVAKGRFSGSGIIYEYRRVSGRWRGRPTEGFDFCGAPGEENKEVSANPNRKPNKALDRRPRSELLMIL